MNGDEYIAQCSMENRPAYTDRLRVYAPNERKFAELVRMAADWGVEIHGKYEYAEKKALGMA